jgi:hypothetical protein
VDVVASEILHRCRIQDLSLETLRFVAFDRRAADLLAAALRGRASSRCAGSIPEV